MGKDDKSDEGSGSKAEKEKKENQNELIKSKVSGYENITQWERVFSSGYLTIKELMQLTLVSKTLREAIFEKILVLPEFQRKFSLKVPSSPNEMLEDRISALEKNIQNL